MGSFDAWRRSRILCASRELTGAHNHREGIRAGERFLQHAARGIERTPFSRTKPVGCVKRTGVEMVGCARNLSQESGLLMHLTGSHNAPCSLDFRAAPTLR